MGRYTSATTLNFDNGQSNEARAIIPEAGVSVVVEFWSGSAWVADELSPVTKARRIFVKNCKVRLTPTGGAFFIDEDGQDFL